MLVAKNTIKFCGEYYYPGDEVKKLQEDQKFKKTRFPLSWPMGKLKTLIPLTLKPLTPSRQSAWPPKPSKSDSLTMRKQSASKKKNEKR